jgi:hypothetical protein
MATHRLSTDRWNDRELTLDELEIVSGGNKAKASSGKNSPTDYLEMNLETCYITSY